MLFQLFYCPQKHIKLLEKEIEDLLDLKSKTSFSEDTVATYLATPVSVDNEINIRKDLIRCLRIYSKSEE